MDDYNDKNSSFTEKSNRIFIHNRNNLLLPIIEKKSEVIVKKYTNKMSRRIPIIDKIVYSGIETCKGSRRGLNPRTERNKFLFNTKSQRNFSFFKNNNDGQKCFALMSCHNDLKEKKETDFIFKEKINKSVNEIMKKIDWFSKKSHNKSIQTHPKQRKIQIKRSKNGQFIPSLPIPKFESHFSVRYKPKSRNLNINGSYINDNANYNFVNIKSNFINERRVLKEKPTNELSRMNSDENSDYLLCQKYV